MTAEDTHNMGEKPKGDYQSLALIIAASIERNISLYLQGKIEELSFVDEVSEHDFTLNDPRNITNVNLSASWNFADSLFDAVTQGFADLDGIPFEEATELAADTAERLRKGQPIEEPRVLRYRNA